MWSLPPFLIRVYVNGAIFKHKDTFTFLKQILDQIKFRSGM
jgi:hypothetical protein